MNKKHLQIVVGLLAAAAVTALALGSAAAGAQSMEVKEKPPLYTYYASWQIPRAKWGDMEKPDLTGQKILQQALSAGSLVGYGQDSNIVHQPDGATHDNWWSATSMAGVLDVLDSFSKSPPPPVLATSTKHSDEIFVSKFYNWRAGTYKGAYTHTAMYRLKDNAPDDAVDSISKTFSVPLLEKLLAEGAIVEYEVDEAAIHTDAPGAFFVSYICPTSAGLDKVTAALGAAFKGNPMIGPALGSMIEDKPHRDYLVRGEVTYK